MNNWALLDNYNFEPVQVIKTTAQMTTYRERLWDGSYRNTRAYSSKIMGGNFTEEQAKRISEQLKSAQAERDRRIREARVWFENRKAELTQRPA